MNAVAVFLFYGAFELHLYVLKRQERRFKYNGKFPSEQKSKAFWFENQNIDNILRTFLSGVTIWTAVEVLVLWAFANGYAPWLSFAEHPFYLAALALVVPIIHEFHFFCIHRLIHTPFLYKWVHSVHHNSVNPSPWSSLSMHPVEHLLYFGTAFYHLIIPSNPVIALYQLHYAAFGAIPGHVGFDKIEVGENGSVDSHAYAHYLHHKYFEVNYGDALIPDAPAQRHHRPGRAAGGRRCAARGLAARRRQAAQRGEQLHRLGRGCDHRDAHGHHHGARHHQCGRSSRNSARLPQPRARERREVARPWSAPLGVDATADAARF